MYYNLEYILIFIFLPLFCHCNIVFQLFISEENETANEFDFRKALELIYYVDDPDDARHKIWCAAILRDSWTSYNMNSPLECMQNMLFFKLIDVCYLMGKYWHFNTSWQLPDTYDYVFFIK